MRAAASLVCVMRLYVCWLTYIYILFFPSSFHAISIGSIPCMVFLCVYFPSSQRLNHFIRYPMCFFPFRPTVLLLILVNMSILPTLFVFVFHVLQFVSHRNFSIYILPFALAWLPLQPRCYRFEMFVFGMAIYRLMILPYLPIEKQSSHKRITLWNGNTNIGNTTTRCSIHWMLLQAHTNKREKEKEKKKEKGARERDRTQWKTERK